MYTFVIDLDALIYMSFDRNYLSNFYLGNVGTPLIIRTRLQNLRSASGTAHGLRPSI